MNSDGINAALFKLRKLLISLHFVYFLLLFVFSNPSSVNVLSLNAFVWTCLYKGRFTLSRNIRSRMKYILSWTIHGFIMKRILIKHGGRERRGSEDNYSNKIQIHCSISLKARNSKIAWQYKYEHVSLRSVPFKHVYSKPCLVMLRYWCLIMKW